MSLVISRSFSYGRSPVSSQRRGGGSTQYCFDMTFAFLFSVAASRVVGKRKHLFKGRYPLIVSLLPEEVESSPEDEREDTLTNDQEKDSRDRESNVGKP